MIRWKQASLRTEVFNVPALELIRPHELVALGDNLADVRNNEVVEIVVRILVADPEDLTEGSRVGLVSLLDLCRARKRQRCMNKGVPQGRVQNPPTVEALPS